MVAREKAIETGLNRRLGLGATAMGGVGVILGAGIYVLVGVAAGEAGNAVWLSSHKFTREVERCRGISVVPRRPVSTGLV